AGDAHDDTSGDAQSDDGVAPVDAHDDADTREADVSTSLALLSIDFTTSPLGALATLPSGLELTRASMATVQTSQNTVITSGIAVGEGGRDHLAAAPNHRR